MQGCMHARWHEFFLEQPRFGLSKRAVAVRDEGAPESHQKKVVPGADVNRGPGVPTVQTNLY